MGETSCMGTVFFITLIVVWMEALVEISLQLLSADWYSYPVLCKMKYDAVKSMFIALD